MIKRYPRTLSFLAFMAIAVAVGLWMMPAPMGTDLSRVGQGRPALVLAFENYSPSGGEALARLNAVRGEYEGRMVFLLADLGTPQGKAFAARHDLRNGQAVVLAGDGTPLSKSAVPADTQRLRTRLDDLLARAAPGASG